MKTTLYRPIGLKELQLIIDLKFKAFPPRLEWQPIFYPILNQDYAEQIASKWNTNDEFSGYCGIVTKFDLSTDYLQKYTVHNVGGFMHNELWIPAEELDEFNGQIIGQIELIKLFLGNNFDRTKTDDEILLVINNLQRDLEK